MTINRKAATQSAILFFLFIICFWGTLAGIVNTWLTNDDYSYGFIIPVMSAYFIWELRHKFKELIFVQDFRALPLLILFFLFSTYGILGSSYSAVRPSIPFILFFLTLFCFGKYAAKLLALPIWFLMFMVPIPSLMNRHVGEPLKIISTKLGTFVMQSLGISVHTTGNIIDLGVTQLQVVDACSGLRFLFPLMALGVAYAYFFQKTTWKRIVSFLLTIPVAILTNGLRIGVTGILYLYCGAETAEGFYHAFEGWLVFMIAFALLFGFGYILKLFPEKQQHSETRQTIDEERDDGDEDKLADAIPSLKNTSAFMISIVLLLSIGIFSWSASALPPVMIKGGIESFPTRIEDWSGNRKSITQEIVDASGAEESFSANYSRENERPVELYLGYRSTPFMENENFFHTPISCFPASGFKILEKGTYVFKNKFDFPDLKATRLVVEKMGEKFLVLFWFQTNKVATHRKSLNRLHLAFHAIQRDNTHDLYVRLMTQVDSNNVKEAEKKLDDFAFQFSKSLNVFFEENLYIEE